MMWNGDGWGHMGSWGWAGIMFMLLFGFGLLALIVWSIVSPRRSQISAMSDGPRNEHALTILRERFSRGEITSEEFEQARKTLRETQP